MNSQKVQLRNCHSDLPPYVWVDIVDGYTDEADTDICMTTKIIALGLVYISSVVYLFSENLACKLKLIIHLLKETNVSYILSFIKTDGRTSQN